MFLKRSHVNPKSYFSTLTLFSAIIFCYIMRVHNFTSQIQEQSVMLNREIENRKGCSPYLAKTLEEVELMTYIKV